MTQPREGRVVPETISVFTSSPFPFHTRSYVLKSIYFPSHSARAIGCFTKRSKARVALVFALLTLFPCLPFLALAHSHEGGVSRPEAPGLHPALRRSSKDTKQKITKSGVDSFTIEMVNGLATCRDATAAEAPSTLPRPSDRGVPTREILKPDPQNQTAIQNGENTTAGLTINLLALSQLRNDSNRNTVIAAFQRAAAIWATRIKSPVTISVNIDYGVNRPDGTAFPSSVLGSTSSGSIAIDYPSARANLIISASSSEESGIYNALPTSVVPTNTGDGSVVAVSRSLTQPLGFLPLNPDDTVATISFNKAFSFDFNPDNGISSGAIDFVAVAAHEIGHALGFVSNAGEGSAAQVALWDLFRFRSSITTSSFTTAQRIMSTGGSQVYFTGQTFVVEGSATTRLGLSTGGPSGDEGDGSQSSHWKADELTGEYIGIMDPTITDGVHESTTENDFLALETLGWNLVDSRSPPEPLPPPGNDSFASAQVLSGCSGSVNGTNLNASKETGEPNHLAPDTGGGSRSVWYQWQPASNGSVTFTTAGSGYDTVLAVYSGNSVGSLGTAIVNNDDVGGEPHDTTSRVTFTANAGTIYRIAVDGYDNGGSGGDMGPIKLNWTVLNCVPASLQFTGITTTVAESAGAAVISVVRTADLSSSVSIGYFTSDGTATVVNSDYSPTLGRLDFAPGDTSKNIIVPINNDPTAEPGETFNITLNNPLNGAIVGTPSAVVVTITDDDAVLPNTVQFNGSTASATETPLATTKVDLTVSRTGDASGAASVNYATSDGTATERSDYLAALGTLKFAAGEVSKTITVFIVNDAWGEVPETFGVRLSNPVGCTISSPSILTVVIDSDESINGPHPVKDPTFSSDFFVRQQYADFFNREADFGGLAFWKNQIDECTTQECREVRRVNVSAAFFVSIEFQQTGYLVYKAYQAALNTGEFLTLRDFLPDLQEVGRGVVIGQPGADAQLEANKLRFFADFVQRAKFTEPANYPITMTAAQFVDKLNANTFDPLIPGSAGSLSLAERDTLVSQLSANPASPTLRAQVLRSISENSLFSTRQSNKAFVLMQYFGYVRRNPNDSPDTDFAGYNFWLGKLNQFNGNYIAAEMVKAFITSGEYKLRFGPD